MEADVGLDELDVDPDVVYERHGQQYRQVVVTSQGSSRVQERKVANSLEEAKVNKQDFRHPTLGWIRYGFKKECDRTPEEIMADSSEATPDPKRMEVTSES